MRNTEVYSVSPLLSCEDIATLERAADIIKSGGLVIFPTETVYGLGADGTNPKAARSIFEAKGRPADNPLIIHIHTPEQAEKYTYTTETYYNIAKHFMPGPITVVLEARGAVPSETRGGLETVAVRCPEHPIANKLIELSGVPIAAPSANLSGSPSPTTCSHCIKDMMGRVDMIIDGGDCDFGLESTIIKLEEEGRVTLLRPGKITVEQLRSIGLSVDIAEAVTAQLKEGEVALSPGMKYRHYAPDAPLYLVDGDMNYLVDYLTAISCGRVAVISYTEDMEALGNSLPDACLYDFGSREDRACQAHRLFELLRRIDGEGFDNIFAPLPDKSGIGLALYNRMIRAAAHQIIKFDGE